MELYFQPDYYTRLESCASSHPLDLSNRPPLSENCSQLNAFLSLPRLKKWIREGTWHLNAQQLMRNIPGEAEMSYERICSPPEPPLCVLLFIKKQSSGPRGIVVKTSNGGNSLFNGGRHLENHSFSSFPSRSFFPPFLFQFYPSRLINVIPSIIFSRKW